MKKSISLLLLSLLMITPSCQKPKEVTNEYNIVPQPNQLVPKEGRFELSNKVRLVVPSDAPEVKKVADGFAEQLKQTAGISLTEAESVDGKPAISFVLQEGMPKEGYKLSVTPTLITVTASQPNGFFYGVQTIYQLLPPAVYGKELKKKADWSVPAVEIEDAPRFVHRGLMLDVCRHYAPIEYIYKFIDLLAMNKMNVFHWHLTDDQGWRIEVKKYPLLTQEGSWRDFDEYDKRCVELSQQDYNYEIDPRFVRNGSQYGGHYTQEEMKGLVSYALERGIDIVPEIDMPGHFSAAIKVYPELSCTGEAGWGEEFSYPICPSRPENYQFVQSIIDEMVEIFPSEYFHIGADEVEKDNWEQCEVCQRLMQQEGYQKVDELQNRFVKIMTNYVKGKGKKVMGWDDAFLEKEPQDLIYTYWRDWLPDQPGKITQKGYPIIFMEWSRFYLSATPSDEGLSSLYNFEFEPQFPGIVKQNVLGFQACVWTEMIPNERKFGQHVFPSLQAFSELAWGSSRNWIDFTNRLKWHVKWLNANGFYFTKPGFL